MAWAILSSCPSNLFAQPTDETVYADRARILTRASIGTGTLPTTSSLGLSGLATTGGTDVLFINGSNEVVRRVLARSDLPSAIAYEDETNTFTQNQTFSGNLIGGSGVLNATSPIRISTTNASYFRVTDTDAGTDRKNWVFFADGDTLKVQGNDDALSAGWPLWTGFRRTSTDLYGITGTPVTYQLGATVRNWLPGLNNVLLMGSPINRIGEFHVANLVAEVFTVIDKQVIGNGSFRVGRGTTLTRDINNSTTTIFIKQRSFRYLDFAILQGLGSSGQPQFEVMRVVQAGVYDCTGAITLPAACGGVDNDDFAVVVERGKQGTARSWITGDGISATDRYLDIFAWQSAMITGGGAILGDRPHFYVNFTASPTPNRAQTSGTVTAINSTTNGATTGGLPGDAGQWNRNGLADAQIFSTAVASLNGSTTGATAFACSMSVELVYYINGTTPGSADAVMPSAKWDGTNLNTATYFVSHYGSASGGLNGQLRMLGYPVGGPIQSLTPLVTPSVGWHHFVFTYSVHNGGNSYVDGVKIGTTVAPVASGACMVTNSNNVTAALWGNNGNPFGGFTSQHALYARELSAEQVKAHYEALQTNHPGLSAGPTIIGYERTSDTDWFGVSERWACGNLVGIYGFQQLTYGCGWGDVTATYTTATASDGFSIWNAGTRVFWANTTGSMSLTKDFTIGSGGSIIGGNFTMNTTGLQVPVTNTSTLDPAFAYKWTGSTRGGNMFIQGYDFSSVSRNLNITNDVTSANQAVITLSASSGFPTHFASVSVNASGSSGTGTSSVDLFAGSNIISFLYTASGGTYLFAPSTAANSTIDLGVSGRRWKELWITPSNIAAGGSVQNPLVVSTTGQVGAFTSGFTGTCTSLPVVFKGLITGC